MQVLDFLIYLPDDILTKVDRASMNHSLEVRVPFLDNNVIDHAFGLEKKYKIKNNKRKLILKKLLKNFLPSSLINRPKMGFGIPLGKLMKIIFRKIEHFYSKNVEKQNIYEVDYIRRLWEEHKVEEEIGNLLGILFFKCGLNIGKIIVEKIIFIINSLEIGGTEKQFSNWLST